MFIMTNGIVVKIQKSDKQCGLTGHLVGSSWNHIPGASTQTSIGSYSSLDNLIDELNTKDIHELLKVNDDGFTLPPGKLSDVQYTKHQNRYVVFKEGSYATI